MNLPDEIIDYCKRENNKQAEVQIPRSFFSAGHGGLGSLGSMTWLTLVDGYQRTLETLTFGSSVYRHGMEGDFRVRFL